MIYGLTTYIWRWFVGSPPPATSGCAHDLQAYYPGGTALQAYQPTATGIEAYNAGASALQKAC